MRRLKAHHPYPTIIFHRLWITLWVNYKNVILRAPSGCSVVLRSGDDPAKDRTEAQQQEAVAGTTGHPAHVIEEDDAHAQTQQTEEQHGHPCG